LEFYTIEELVSILRRGARLLGFDLAEDGAVEIARRARGTPRVATRLLRRVRDFATVERAKSVDRDLADRALLRLDVDRLGLDTLDRRYLKMIANAYGGGPVGIETLSAALAEERDTIEETVEPFLIQQGLVQRTPRGRMLTRPAWLHLGETPPASIEQPSMFDEPPP
ncbi:Holliday junction DNA helicase RuvB C-terminal domain-containing protein, partial [Geminicoccus harenae]